MKLGRAAVGEILQSKNGNSYQVVRYATPEESILEELRKGRPKGTRDPHEGCHRYLVQAVRNGKIDESVYFVMNSSTYLKWARGRV